MCQIKKMKVTVDDVVVVVLYAGDVVVVLYAGDVVVVLYAGDVVVVVVDGDVSYPHHQ